MISFGLQNSRLWSPNLHLRSISVQAYPVPILTKYHVSTSFRNKNSWGRINPSTQVHTILRYLGREIPWAWTRPESNNSILIRYCKKLWYAAQPSSRLCLQYKLLCGTPISCGVRPTNSLTGQEFESFSRKQKKTIMITFSEPWLWFFKPNILW